jgi:hypothetical protein
MHVMIVVQGQAVLFEVVLALRSPRRLPCLLYGWQQESDQDGDNGDHHQQLDQREPGMPSSNALFHDEFFSKGTKERET